ncbi:hypothetical protein PIROE2DRAFT_62800, partial [Piromyces sp. E2]
MSRIDPDQCTFRGNVIINKGNCYYTSYGGETTIENLISRPKIRFYDIDANYNRALTEYGWCDYSPEVTDATWMSNINQNLTLNQINIPGTHDSGTKTGKLYYLSDIFDEAIKFLHYYPSETVIIHLKNDAVVLYDDREGYNPNKKEFGTMEYYYEIAKLSIYNFSSIYNTLYCNYFYKENELFPTLEKAKGKIVLLTRGDFLFKEPIYNNPISVGKKLDIPEMGSCNDHSWYSHINLTYPATKLTEIHKPLNYPKDAIDYVNNFHETCFPRIKISIEGYNYLVQDNYILPKEEKWSIIKDTIDNNTPTGYEKDKAIFNIYGKDHSNTSMFYDKDNKNILTINFMNIQAAKKFLRSIKGFANDINDKLYDYLKNKSNIHNQWMILDFPSPDLICRIRETTNNGLTKRSEIQNNAIQVGDYLIYLDLYYYIQTLPSVSDDDIPACLQRKTIINSQGQSQELIKTNNKCVNNKMNKWFIRQN